MTGFDLTTTHGERTKRRLEEEDIIWLTTTRPADSVPQPSPVWFLWENGEILIYSQREKPKLRNIQSHSKIALHFNSDAAGGDIVIITGEARIDPAAPGADQMPAYLAKYHASIERLGLTDETFAQEYSVAIRVAPVSLRGF